MVEITLTKEQRERDIIKLLEKIILTNFKNT